MAIWNFYDTETSGKSTRFDITLQYADIVTDVNFEEIEAVNWRGKRMPQIIPSPGALAVTHIDPNSIKNAPHSNYQLATRIHGRIEQLKRDNGEVIISGYNIIKFDEEKLRSEYYQNLLYPYITSGKGVLRVDFLPIIRAAWTIDPSKIKIAWNEEDNMPSFRLDAIATLNGFQGHNAHDALGDVRATIFMAKHIRDNYPGLLELFIQNARLYAVRDLLSRNRMIHLHESRGGHPAVLEVCPLVTQDGNDKNHAVFDLSVNPAPFIALSEDELYDRCFAPRGRTESRESYDYKYENNPFRTVKTNQTPSVFSPTGSPFHLDDPVDVDTAVKRIEMMKGNSDFLMRVSRCLKRRQDSYDKPVDIEDKIYDGFGDPNEKFDGNIMRQFHKTNAWPEKLSLVKQLKIAKNRQFGMRIIYDNAPELLPDTLKAQIVKYLYEERMNKSSSEEYVYPEAPEDIRNEKWNTFEKSRKELVLIREQKKADEDFINTIEEWLSDFEQEMKKQYEDALALLG